jgi:hypothetical protein
VGEGTPVLTTVHALQVVEDEIPMAAHDVPVDLVVTPEREIRTRRRRRKPRGVIWRQLSEAQLAEMPVSAPSAGAAERRPSGCSRAGWRLQSAHPPKGPVRHPERSA